MTNTRAGNRTGRQLILIDIENVAQTSAPSAKRVEAVIRALQAAVPGFNGAHRVVACSHHAAQTVAFACGTARQIWRSGSNGADKALLEVIEEEHVAERFDRVTICSGDGIFTAAIARLAEQGVHTLVVSGQDSLASRLRLAACEVKILDARASSAPTGDVA